MYWFLPVGSQVEHAPSWTGSPTSYSVHWCHSAVRFKNSVCQSAMKNHCLEKKHSLVCLINLKKTARFFSDFTSVLLNIQIQEMLCHSALLWSKALTVWYEPEYELTSYQLRYFKKKKKKRSECQDWSLWILFSKQEISQLICSALKIIKPAYLNTMIKWRLKRTELSIRWQNF